MKEMAIAKLDKELAALKGDQNVEVMKKPVHDALVDFCQQNEEFAQAVVQGGSFSECMAAVAKGAGIALSDLEAYSRAVQYFFPGAGIRVQMSINLCASVEGPQEATPSAPQKPEPVLLDLFDLL